jgi:hypothetical protein
MPAVSPPAIPATAVVPPATATPRPSARPPTPDARPRPAPRAAPAILVHYIEKTHVTVIGPSSGRRYQFSPGAPFQLVLTQDAGALLQLRQFRRA